MPLQFNSKGIIQGEAKGNNAQQQIPIPAPIQNQYHFESVFDTLKLLELREKFNNPKDMPTLMFDWQAPKNSQMPMKQLIPNDQKDILPIIEDKKTFKCGHLYFVRVDNSSNSPNAQLMQQTQGNLIMSHEAFQEMIQKKSYFILKKGKLYKFVNENSDYSYKMLDIRNCLIDLVTIQRPDQTLANSASCNLEQAIHVKSFNQSFYFTMCSSRVCPGENVAPPHKRREQLHAWFQFMKQYCTMQNLKSYYEIGSLLGKGNFAKVYEATLISDTEKKFALKTIQKRVLSKCKRNFQSLLEEVSILRKLDHDNIIKLMEVYESMNNVHLVLEHLNGGELFDRIRQKGQYCESDAAVIMRCILRALVEMHSKNIVHRDLKPENMLFKNESIDSLKIVDFGLSSSTKKGPLNMRCGSPGYVAPEILSDQGYGCKVDVFSAGIILYILLTGKFIFSGKDYKEILNKNRECIVPYPPQYWNQLSSEAKDLVQQMLQKNPDNRPNSFEVLQHPWLGLGSLQIQPSLFINFDEIGEAANILNSDEEPSLAGTLNLQLVTTSPIWNKSMMRNMLRVVNQEQDKQSTFQTPAPNPRFNNVSQNFAFQRLQAISKQARGNTNNNTEAQDKQPLIINGGIVVQNLFINNNTSSITQQQSDLQNNTASINALRKYLISGGNTMSQDQKVKTHMSNHLSKQQQPLECVIEEDNKVVKKDCSSESESEIVDFDENINTLSQRCKVSDFNPNSNKEMMRKCTLREEETPVMTISMYDQYQKSGSGQPPSQASAPKHRFFALNSEPEIIQPPKNISVISPGNSVLIPSEILQDPNQFLQETEVVPPSKFMPSISQQKVNAVHTLLRLSYQTSPNKVSSDNLIYQSCHQQQNNNNILDVQVSCEDEIDNLDCSSDDQGDSDDNDHCLQINPVGLKLSSQMENHQSNNAAAMKGVSVLQASCLQSELPTPRQVIVMQEQMGLAEEKKQRAAELIKMSREIKYSGAIKKQLVGSPQPRFKGVEEIKEEEQPLRVIQNSVKMVVSPQHLKEVKPITNLIDYRKQTNTNKAQQLHSRMDSNYEGYQTAYQSFSDIQHQQYEGKNNLPQAPPPQVNPPPPFVHEKPAPLTNQFTFNQNSQQHQQNDLPKQQLQQQKRVNSLRKALINII